jgi:hypothetical protein
MHNFVRILVLAPLLKLTGGKEKGCNAFGFHLQSSNKCIIFLLVFLLSSKKEREGKNSSLPFSQVFMQREMELQEMLDQTFMFQVEIPSEVSQQEVWNLEIQLRSLPGVTTDLQEPRDFLAATRFFFLSPDPMSVKWSRLLRR